MKTDSLCICPWAINNPLMRSYHDNEWGIPVYDDVKLFELLILEGAQAGLSWQTVLNRREGYRKAFAGFDPTKVALFDENKIDELMLDPGIIRHRLKIEGVVINARLFLNIQEEFGSFAAYLWSFVNHKTIKNTWRTMQEVPAETKESQAMSKDLKKRGFKFVGPTIMYAYMQAAGLVNDHLEECPFKQKM